MNHRAPTDVDEKLVTFVMSLGEAEDLVEILDEVCCRMRHIGRSEKSRVELTIALPQRRRPTAPPSDGR